MRPRSPQTKLPCASTTSSPGSTPSRTATAATLASPPTSLSGHSAARSSHGAKNTQTIVRLRGVNTSRRFAKPTPETLHRSWPSRDASARIEIRLVLTDPVARRNDGRLRLCGLLRQLGAVMGFKTPVPPAKSRFSRRELSFDTPHGRAVFPCKSAVTEFMHPTRPLLDERAHRAPQPRRQGRALRLHR